MNILEIKNLSKFYVLTHQRQSRISLRQILVQRLTSLRPQTTTKFFALNNVSFSLKKGETLGIIGSNGSGKTTLLKILAGISLPSKGEVTIYGTITPLMTLGLGFHLDLTGRENIFLNAAILGYSQKEIKKKIHTIISFAELEKFIDLPIRYYSSGMYSRLGFSVATTPGLEPDILLIDETLAVGDASFHKKSFQRMKELVNNKKTSIILVSHDLLSIKELCTSCIWMEKGTIKMYGKTSQVIFHYKKFSQKK